MPQKYPRILIIKKLLYIPGIIGPTWVLLLLFFYFFGIFRSILIK